MIHNVIIGLSVFGLATPNLIKPGFQLPEFCLIKCKILHVFRKLPVKIREKILDIMGVQPAELCREVHKIHIFTHIRWEMTGYHIRCRVKDNSFTWATPEMLRTTYALPTAFRIFLDE